MFFLAEDVLIHRFRVAGAFILVPVLMIVGMSWIRFFVKPVFTEALQGLSGGSFFGMDFIVTLLCLGAFVGLVAGVYWWVSHGGPGVFR